MSDEVLWELPDTWQWTTIVDLGDVISGGTPSTKDPSYWNGEINWITPADLSGYSSKFIMRGAKSLTIDGLENSSAKLMPAGSIHFSSRAPVGYVVISQAEISTNQGFKSLIPAQGIFNEYIYYYLKSAKHIAEEKAGGTTFKELSGKAFSQLPVPIAPLNEQYRIVNQIEKFLSDFDKGVEYFKTTQEQLRVYRQSVLKAAFEGKLTEEWRKAHAAQLETTDQLLERIQQERENLYQQQLNDWEEAIKAWEENGNQGKTPKRPQQLKHMPELSEKSLSMLPPLPEGWTWTCSGNLFQFVTSGSRGWAKYYSNEGAIFVRITNLNFDSLELDLAPEKIQYVQPPSNQEGMRTYVEEGDFLFSITGYLGMFAIAPVLEEAYVNQHIALARPLPGFNKKFIGYYITSRTGGFHYLNQLTKGVVKAGLTLGDIVSFPIPLCSIEEQEEIVNLVEMRLSRVYELDQEIKIALQQAEVLRQSILKKAFSGRLVPQDPNDKPANILLEQIRAERQAAPKPTRKLGTSKKKPRKKEVVKLISVLESASDWLNAQDAFRECGVSDGAETEVIEKLFLELRDLEKEARIEVERRGDEDWLRIRSTDRS